MADRPWKRFERQANGLIGGRRFLGQLRRGAGCEGPTVVAQCKYVRHLSPGDRPAERKSIATDDYSEGTVSDDAARASQAQDRRSGLMKRLQGKVAIVTAAAGRLPDVSLVSLTGATN